MPVIVSYRGGQRAAEVLEEAVSWTFGPSTVKLWGPMKDGDKPLLVEIDVGEVVRLEHFDTPMRRLRGLQKKEQ
jgi:hypothetical protein